MSWAIRDHTDLSESGHPFEAPGFVEDPHPVYDALRAHPVHRLLRPEGQEFLVTGHAEADRILRDERFSSNRLAARVLAPGFDALPEDLRPEAQSPSMLTVDPPHHTRLRRPVGRSFSPRRMQALEEAVEQEVARLLDDMRRGSGTVDLVATLAEPLPAIVIAWLLGVPAEDHARFQSWARTLLRPLVASDTGDLAGFRRARAELGDYLGRIVAARGAEPRDDIVSDLVQAGEEGALTPDEVLAACHLLLVAGSETTTNLIATGVGTLLLHPPAWSALRNDPERLGSAVEELLRFESPLQGVARVALEDVEISGVAIPRRALVSVMLGAANRDPAVFDDPHRLDLGREPNPHLAFGAGVHFCLGASLARLEARVALAALLERYPRLALAEPRLRFRRGFLLRGVSTLPVSLAG